MADQADYLPEQVWYKSRALEIQGVCGLVMLPKSLS